MSVASLLAWQEAHDQLTPDLSCPTLRDSAEPKQPVDVSLQQLVCFRLLLQTNHSSEIYMVCTGGGGVEVEGAGEPVTGEKDR